VRVRKPPSLRNNNGVIQLRVRVDGQDRFINRLGRFQDPIAVARAQTLSAQIWQEHQDRSFDPTLAKYQPIVPGTADPTLVGALKEMADRTGYPRVIHAQRLVERYGKPLRTAPQVLEFVRWMEMQGLSPTTRVGILSACRKVQPTNEALRVAGLKVSHRFIEYEVLSRTEVLQVLADLKRNDPWFHPIFAFWLGTGLRNSELIGMTWDCTDGSNRNCW
jgi:integrase